MKNGSDEARENGAVNSKEIQQKRDLAVLQSGKAFAEIVGILMDSPNHRHFFISDLEWMVLPALGLRQFRIFQDGKRARAFAIWAHLSEDVEKEFLARGVRMRPDQWRSGDRLWLIDIIGATANPKLTQQILGDLVKGPFAGKEFKMVVSDPKTGKRRVMAFGPKSAKKQLDKAAGEKSAEA